MAMLSLILICSGPYPTLAADGDLDKSFGKGGIVMTDFDTPLGPAGAFNFGRTVAIQADGKIVAGGETDHNGRTMDAALARYNVDGSLDATFGSGGKVITPDVPGLDEITIQPDGKILAASGGGLLRYGPDGSLDASFGSGGKVANPGTISLALQPDGEIVAGGVSSPDNGVSFVFAVRRFSSDGSPEATFGSGGTTTVDLPGHYATLTKVALQPDGKIIAGGWAQPGPGRSPAFWAIARLNADGSIDAGFGSAGIVTAPFHTSVLAIAVRDGGKILVTGSDFEATGPFFAAARYNPDGSPDSTFGNSGIVSSAFLPEFNRPGTDRHLHAVAIGPEGKFIAAGDAGQGIALARYNGDGSPDNSFGAGGSVVTHITPVDFPPTGYRDTVRGIAFQADGQIVVTGDVNVGDHLVLARYNTEPDFALSFSQSTETLSPGSKAKVTLNIARRGGFTGNVTVTPPDTSALDIRIVPDSVTTTGDSVRFKIKVRGDTPLGSHPLVFGAQSDAGQAHSVTLNLVVQ